MTFHTDADETTPKVTAEDTKCLLTNKQTNSWSGVLRDNLTGPQLVKKFFAFY
jgi:hypothetical protein